MSINWTVVNDTYPFASDDQVRISVSFNCVPLSKITAADISNFLQQQQAIQSVLNVGEGWTDAVSQALLFECAYQATVNPQPGMTAGDLRAAMYTAIAQANETHTIKSDNVLVGAIERASTSIIPDGPSTKTTISLAAVAIVAIVVLVVFLKLD